MEDRHAKLETSIRNSAFSALLCSALGFVLLEAWTIRMGGKPIAHILILSVGAIVACAIYRTILSRSRSAPMQSSEAVRDKYGKRPGIANMSCAALLAIFGYAGAMSLSSGSMTIFAAFAIVTSICPWSKLVLCRTHIFVPAALITVAMVLGLPAADEVQHPFLFPIAVWMLWMAAVSAWLMNICFRGRKSKAPMRVAHQRDGQPADVVQS